MRSLRFLILAVPVLATVAIPFVPAEAHRRHDGGGALIAGLIGLGLGAVAGRAFTGQSNEYEPAYAQPSYAPPQYGYVPAYAAPPPVYYAPPPRVVYVQPPVVAYAPPGYYVQQRVYAQPRPRYYEQRTIEAGWGSDDD